MDGVPTDQGCDNGTWVLGRACDVGPNPGGHTGHGIERIARMTGVAEDTDFGHDGEA
jgi:hypothetical protein